MKVIDFACMEVSELIELRKLRHNLAKLTILHQKLQKDLITLQQLVEIVATIQSISDRTDFKLVEQKIERLMNTETAFIFGRLGIGIACFDRTNINFQKFNRSKFCSKLTMKDFYLGNENKGIEEKSVHRIIQELGQKDKTIMQLEGDFGTYIIQAKIIHRSIKQKLEKPVEEALILLGLLV
jgi:alanine racemase